ncbi:MAG: alpha/beta hydrolase-fold protein [Gammaproteobacteria bacterium]
MYQWPITERPPTSLLGAIVAISLWTSGEVDAQTTTASGVTESGVHQLTLPDSGRRYTLSIPEGYTGQDPVPLIVSLHYGGQVTPYFGRGLLESLIEPAFREFNAIVVAPDSAAGNWANPTSEQHVLALLDQIEAHYNIDGNRTLLTGYSMGGSGTWYLAPRHPDRFSAALVMAGRPQADATTLDWTTPLYVIHSAADEVAPLEPTQATVDQLLDQDVSVHLVIADDITHYEISRYRSYLVDSIPWIRQAWAE